MHFLLVFMGGGAGCILRYIIGLGFQKTTSSLPWATLFSNISACIIFAFVLWVLQTKAIGGTNLKVLLLTGFCGGLSTFSTFGYETYLLLKQSFYMYALLNVVVSSSICILIFYIFN